MRQRINPASLMLVVFVAVAGAASVGAQKPPEKSPEEQAIRAAGRAYLAARARGDAKTLSEAWTADGDYVDAAGQTFKAHELIRQEFPQDAAGAKPPAADGAAGQPKAAAGQQAAAAARTIAPASTIRFIKPDVAIEDGATETAAAAGRRARQRFTAVWVKQGGRWLLDGLREASASPPGPETLDELQWLVGDWIAEEKNGTLRLSCGWSEDQKFLLADFSVRVGESVILSGTQRIGWDPSTHRVKSWFFDSQGGYGEGDWSGSGGDWIVKVSQVLPDGSKTTATSNYRRDGDNAFSWKTTESRVEGQIVPEHGVQFKRQAAVK
jgi:ketosteroid isomerase-like protein